MDDGGIEAIEEWINAVHNPRLVIIDVFGKVRLERDACDSAYEADYLALSPLKQLADEKSIAVLIVHHIRKMAAEDPFDTVTDTIGFTGAADTISVLSKTSRGTTLYGRGRDIEEIGTALSFDRTTGSWSAMGAVSEVRGSDER